MQPVNTPKPKVVVEYDSKQGRLSKSFDDCYAARRFYVQKVKQGLNPQVKGEK